MAEPVVVSMARQFRADLLAREEAQMREMTSRWLSVETLLDGQIQALAQELATEQGVSGVVTQARLYRMQRYQTLLAQLRQEVAGYQDYAEHTISAQQLSLAELGAQQAAQSITASSATVAISFDRLPVGAVQTMVGMAQDKAPLGQLLAAAYPEAAQGLTTALIRGVSLGWGPAKTAAAMRQGSEMGLQRSLVIARSEQLRAYRIASNEQYKASGVVRAQKRLAAHSDRTCLACLSRDGEILPIAQPLSDHVCGRCAAIPVLIGEPAPRWESGKQWFDEQSAEAQRQMMGDRRLAAYRAGKFRFADLARVTHDDVWGSGLRVASLGELNAQEMATS